MSLANRTGRAPRCLTAALVLAFAFGSGCGYVRPGAPPLIRPRADAAVPAQSGDDLPVPAEEVEPQPQSTAELGEDRVLAPPASPTEPAFTGRLVEVVYEKGRAHVVARRILVRPGTTVRITVQSDKDEELLVHGYNQRVAITPGKAARVQFTAAQLGTFLVELTRSKTKLFDIVVK